MYSLGYSQKYEPLLDIDYIAGPKIQGYPKGTLSLRTTPLSQAQRAHLWALQVQEKFQRQPPLRTTKCMWANPAYSTSPYIWNSEGIMIYLESSLVVPITGWGIDPKECSATTEDSNSQTWDPN